jgi:site-specific recombinase XerD
MLLDRVRKPLHEITLEDLVEHRDWLASHYAPATVNRALSAARSLFKFAQAMGYLRYNPAVVVPGVRKEDTLAERILTTADVDKIISRANGREATLIKLLYYSGCRISEIMGLEYRNLVEREDGCGQITVFGKRGKTRSVLIPISLLRELGWGKPTERIFKFSTRYAQAIVRRVTERAGFRGVSPHWLRHAHASHALNAGAPIQLVRDTLGHASVKSTDVYLHARPGESSSLYLVGGKKQVLLRKEETV